MKMSPKNQRLLWAAGLGLAMWAAISVQAYAASKRGRTSGGS